MLNKKKIKKTILNNFVSGCFIFLICKCNFLLLILLYCQPVLILLDFNFFFDDTALLFLESKFFSLVMISEVSILCVEIAMLLFWVANASEKDLARADLHTYIFGATPVYRVRPSKCFFSKLWNV